LATATGCAAAASQDRGGGERKQQSAATAVTASTALGGSNAQSALDSQLRRAAAHHRTSTAGRCRRSGRRPWHPHTRSLDGESGRDLNLTVRDLTGHSTPAECGVTEGLRDPLRAAALSVTWHGLRPRDSRRDLTCLAVI
jgi:hypothetical protein